MEKLERQTLLIDADNTLWENNIYFERAIAAFISFLNHHEYSPGEIRQVLNQVERENLVRHGYGLHSFAHALVGTFERLSREPITPALHRTIHGFAHTIAEQPMEIIDGVLDTLAYLQPRHRLLLVTKGNVNEQTGKIARSGLRAFFQAVEVLSEKDTLTYRALIQSHQLPPQSTWMVGNSPKSDINPALEAGLHAVFVPHADTWVLEHEELAEACPPQRLLRVERFADLAAHF